MEREEVRRYVNIYCHLRDVQYAAYTNYARRFNLTTNELFVLDIIWFAPEGCTQAAKIIRLTDSGRKYVKAVIQPAADAEIDAMAELDGADIAELVRLTEKFSEMMSKKFSEA